jgi:6-phosphogluconolactonase
MLGSIGSRAAKAMGGPWRSVWMLSGLIACSCGDGSAGQSGGVVDAAEASDHGISTQPPEASTEGGLSLADASEESGPDDAENGGSGDALAMSDVAGEPTMGTGSTYVYVCGEALSKPNAGGPAPNTMTLMTLDRETGVLSPVVSFPAEPRTPYVAVAPDKSSLYAESGHSPAKVMAFSIARDTGRLTLLNEVSTAGDAGIQQVDSAPSHITVHASGRWILASHLPTGHVAVLPILSGGFAGAPVDVKLAKKGAHQVVFDRSAKHLLVPCRDSDVVAQFVFDAETGVLVPNDPPFVQVPAGSGPRHIALHPSERVAYLLNQYAGTIFTYDYDAATGKLSNPAPTRTTPEGSPEKAAAHVLAHPSGRFLYVSNRDRNLLTRYVLDPTTGRPGAAEFHSGDGQLEAPQDFDVDSSGRYLVVINEGRGGKYARTVVSFAIDQDSGTLTRIGTPLPVPYLPLCARITAL